MITHATTRGNERFLHVVEATEQRADAAVRFYAPTALYVTLEGVYMSDEATHYLYRTIH